MSLPNFVLAGDSGAGKTSIMLRLLNNSFIDGTNPTIGVDMEHYSVKISDKVIKIRIWDTSAQVQYRVLFS